MTSIVERIKWIILEHQDKNIVDAANAVVREIERTHRIIDPEAITEGMLEACFNALPEHYDPPDMSRRPWHALKAKRRYTAMVKAADKCKLMN